MIILIAAFAFVLYAGVVNNNLKTNDRFTVPVTTAEFAVMRTAFSVRSTNMFLL